jgi:hypothetical protein
MKTHLLNSHYRQAICQKIWFFSLLGVLASTNGHWFGVTLLLVALMDVTLLMTDTWFRRNFKRFVTPPDKHHQKFCCADCKNSRAGFHSRSAENHE